MIYLAAGVINSVDSSLHKNKGKGAASITMDSLHALPGLLT